MPVKITWKPGHDELPRIQWVLDDKAYAAFGAYGVVHELTAGERVFEEWSDSPSLYLVMEGEVSILRAGEEVARIRQNHSFGEMGLLLGESRSADAEAATDARVLELRREDLDRMMAEDPVWAARLYRVLAECLAEYMTNA